MRALLLALPLLLLSGLRAQVPLFQRITEKDGLVFNEVHALRFDQRGVLWIGTAMGLSRFDGSGFRTYARAQGLPAPRVYDIACDSTGVLWLGTMNGLVRLDPRTDSLRSWLMDTAGTAAPVANQVVGVRALANGKVLCVGRGVLFVCEPATGQVRRIRTDDGRDVTAYHYGVLTDSAATGSWICMDGVGVGYFDAATERITLPSSGHRHPLLRGVRASHLVRDQRGRIWTDDLSDGGMNLYRPADGALQHWSHVPGAKELVYDQGLVLLHCDEEDRLWVGDWILPPCLVNLKDSTWVRLPADPDDPATLTHGTITSCAHDARGQLWLGTLNGISVHDPERFKYARIRIPQVMGEPKAWPSGMAEDEAGRVWLAVRPDLVRLDAQDQVEERVSLKAGKDAASVYDVIHANALLWVSTSKGLFRFDPATGERALVHGAGSALHGIPFGWLRGDRSGRIWGLQPFDRAAIRCYDPRTGGTRLYAPDSTDIDGSPYGTFHDLLCASDGSIWMGSEGAGLVRLDPASGAFISNIPDIRARRVQGIRVLCLAEDASGRIWYMADGVGLVRYEPGKGSYKVYDSAHGLPIPAGSGIAVDRQGRLWIGLLNGMACFDPEQERFIPVDVDRGQESNDMGRAVMTRRNGEVWMSQWQELIRFDPAGASMRKPPLAPVITGIWAYSDRLLPAPGGELRLRHTQDQIRIRYASFDAPGRIKRYFVRVLPDSAWQEGDEGDVTISKMAPGRYRYQFRTLSDDAQWSPITELAVRVVPPWWQTLVARIAFALLLATAIVLAFRLRLDWIRRRERRAEAMERTVNDLKLRALRAQMNPHFVFNCMNSIDKYILMNEPEKASRYLNRFAKLVRLILNQSDSVSVPLDKEVEMLRYYLELEALRFEEPFLFEVAADPLLLNEDPELPAMLVQPYVENAIWHGLQHKRGRGRIRVEFRKLGDNLVVTVEDDGVGRAEAARIKAQRSAAHSSKAMQVNADRMRLMEELKLGGASVAIDDLMDREGRALGTRVTITLPMDALRDEAWAEREEA